MKKLILLSLCIFSSLAAMDRAEYRRIVLTSAILENDTVIPNAEETRALSMTTPHLSSAAEEYAQLALHLTTEEEEHRQLLNVADSLQDVDVPAPLPNLTQEEINAHVRQCLENISWTSMLNKCVTRDGASPTPSIEQTNSGPQPVSETPVNVSPGSHKQLRQALFPCSEDGCTQSFPTKKEVGYHALREHNKGIDTFICPNFECPAVYKVKSSLVTHIRRLHGKSQPVSETPEDLKTDAVVAPSTPNSEKEEDEINAPLTSNGWQFISETPIEVVSAFPPIQNIAIWATQAQTLLAHLNSLSELQPATETSADLATGMAVAASPPNSDEDEDDTVTNWATRAQALMRQLNISPNSFHITQKGHAQLVPRSHQNDDDDDEDDDYYEDETSSEIEFSQDLGKQTKRKAQNFPKRFKCTANCSQSFATKKERDIHILRMHNNGIEPFICQVPGCPLKYTTKASLNVHIIRIHGERKYKCRKCGDCYAFKGDLDQHIKRTKHN